MEPARPPATGGHGTLAVLLAAGGGTRYEGPGHKLVATIDGARVFDLALDAARRAGIGPVLVVTGSIDAPDLGVPEGVDAVANPDWADGQATSLQCAIAVARRRDADAVVVGLADQPFVTAEAWRAVAAATGPIAHADYGGRRGNPVRLHRSIWHLLPTTGDEGARAVMRVHPDLVEPVPSPGSPDDIDTLEDLHRWQSNSSTNSP